MLNIFRLLAIVFVAIRYKEYFDYLHVYFAQSVMIAVSLAAILLSVHLFYLYSLETLALTLVIYDKNLRDVGYIEMNVHVVMYHFTDYLLLRFEPFLMGFILYFTFVRKSATEQRSKLQSL